MNIFLIIKGSHVDVMRLSLRSFTVMPLENSCCAAIQSVLKLKLQTFSHAER